MGASTTATPSSTIIGLVWVLVVSRVLLTQSLATRTGW